MNMSISVIIPAFNASRFIAQAIESVLNQDYKGIVQLIIIDDGSTDDTVEVLKNYANQVFIIQKPNGGVSSTRNVGLKAAQHDFVALLDADDVMKPGRLAAQAAALAATPEAVLCYSSVEFIDDSGNLLESQPKLLSEPSDTSNTTTKRLFDRNFITTSSVMFRRSPVLAINGFNEKLNFSEDCDLWLRLSQSGQFILLPQRLTQYRIHSSQTIRHEAGMARGRLLARAYFLRQYPEQRQILGTTYIRKKMALYASDYGYPLFLSGDPCAARSVYRLGLQHAPLNLKLWRLYLRSFFPI